MFRTSYRKYKVRVHAERTGTTSKVVSASETVQQEVIGNAAAVLRLICSVFSQFLRGKGTTTRAKAICDSIHARYQCNPPLNHDEDTKGCPRCRVSCVLKRLPWRLCHVRVSVHGRYGICRRRGRGVDSVLQSAYPAPWSFLFRHELE